MTQEASLHIAPAVQAALDAGRPVVALESTLISHGLPAPTNLETARGLEAVVREHGATPATIAILHGQIRVGLDDAALRTLTTEPVRKLSRRDLAAAVVQEAHGATTVAATMWIAHRVGIRVFATGGIGGVHRGAGETWDVSADLPELAQTPVLVVCAGAKSLLDLPKTREYLETWGVPVLGYGTAELPAFYTPHSGLSVDARVDTPAQAAAIARTHWALGGRGLLVTVPVPPDQALAAQAAEDALAQAVAEAETQGIGGARLTPFVLARVKDLTGGESLRANVALLLNNTAVAAQIACALAS
ncbi:MAG: pseudouridine-5'-phosphate glycosidase [Chloroflexi bacterium]|nr:pseudouridine-5'-phosphate glycosidase [Chloroflexota bacterium]MBU1746968.1 pseudouridine-5'-phosphate glycosidase [Chloroflexota bacterium]